MKTFKKLFFFFAIIWLMPFIASAGSAPDERDVPIVLIEVTKTDGGFFSIFNLYKEVQFTLVDKYSDMITATLHCRGAGFTPCRVPVGVVTSTGGTNAGHYTELFGNERFEKTVNGMIEHSEKEWENGKLYGTVTKKVSIMQNGTSKLYVFTGTWRYDKYGNGRMSIKVYDNLSIMTPRI